MSPSATSVAAAWWPPSSTPMATSWGCFRTDRRSDVHGYADDDEDEDPDHQRGCKGGNDERQEDHAEVRHDGQGIHARGASRDEGACARAEGGSAREQE